MVALVFAINIALNNHSMISQHHLYKVTRVLMLGQGESLIIQSVITT